MEGKTDTATCSVSLWLIFSSFLTPFANSVMPEKAAGSGSFSVQSTYTT